MLFGGVRKNKPIKSSIFGNSHIEVKDIAEYCLVSTSTVRRWLKEGQLKSFQLPSNQYRIRIEDFKDFLRRYKIPINEDFFLKN
jgi:excisionase family DNA binding protein